MRLAASSDGADAPSVWYTNNISATGGASSQGGTLLQRLDAIGTGELSPKYGEKNFDWNM